MNPHLTIRDLLVISFRLCESRLKPRGPYLTNEQIESEISHLLVQADIQYSGRNLPDGRAFELPFGNTNIYENAAIKLKLDNKCA